jgi:hypothetical protein
MPEELNESNDGERGEEKTANIRCHSREIPVHDRMVFSTTNCFP